MNSFLSKVVRVGLIAPSVAATVLVGTTTADAAVPAKTTASHVKISYESNRFIYPVADVSPGRKGRVVTFEVRNVSGGDCPVAPKAWKHLGSAKTNSRGFATLKSKRVVECRYYRASVEKDGNLGAATTKASRPRV